MLDRKFASLGDFTEVLLDIVQGIRSSGWKWRSGAVRAGDRADLVQHGAINPNPAPRSIREPDLNSTFFIDIVPRFVVMELSMDEIELYPLYPGRVGSAGIRRRLCLTFMLPQANQRR